MNHILTFVLMLVAGCSSVVMNEPFPDTKLAEADMKALQGTWQLGNAVLYLQFTANGTPALASVEWAEDSYTLIRHNVHITKRDDLFYLSIQAQPGEDPPGHHFAVLKPRENEIVAWGPDVDFFKAQVEADSLKGSIKEDEHATQVMLTTPAQDVLELISSEADSISYRNPLILQRIQ